MLIVIMLNVVMLNVVVPSRKHENVYKWQPQHLVDKLEDLYSQYIS
jgi:hypothetical protein